MTPQQIADAIKALTVNDLNELRRLLDWDGPAARQSVCASRAHPHLRTRAGRSQHPCPLTTGRRPSDTASGMDSDCDARAVHVLRLGAPMTRSEAFFLGLVVGGAWMLLCVIVVGWWL